ncbi:MAG: hypothetical protein AAGG44_01885 [Planctomycetota bacterium]
MKRVGEFEIYYLNRNRLDSSERRMGKEDWGKPATFESWHKACDSIAAKLVAESAENIDEAVAVDAKTTRILARFSSEDLDPGNEDDLNRSDSDSSKESVRAWNTVHFNKPTDESETLIYENRNIVDFHWEMPDGARRDVPFRLTLLERNAESNPICMTILTEMQKLRDMFGSPFSGR